MSKEHVYRVQTLGDLQSTLAMVARMGSQGLQKGEIEIALRRPKQKRTTDQNRLLWAILRDVSEQVEWYGQHLSSEEWKDVFTVSLKRQKVVPGIDGGFIMVGGRTSKMNKAEFSDLVELIHAFGADHQVRWSDPALKAYEQIREAA
ncbi:recombination protein NinB [Halomonas sp. McH1-25]|uniref:recombination protein NinB n=1 Tax=unclassified Halomonas TaxID=2609666 RepID=UPI001EF61805|nr:MULTISPECIES: recombination protein NinB [unclassified Halomonas]MCG7598853.1 recombination protein NinB [Halomonas sp. McH1-25]MCP1340816.1 recombination protein NinB [Halomonas sp. FL8]MCP1361301.1 recombination protein NinB [Halomonas sp. BBD45]MCP1364332.1 recombination protein NinB [Halomonas sp. BBD48]